MESPQFPDRAPCWLEVLRIVHRIAYSFGRLHRCARQSTGDDGRITDYAEVIPVKPIAPLLPVIADHTPRRQSYANHRFMPWDA